MGRFLHDLFFPHLHNNYRSRLLHHKSLVFGIIFLFAGSFFLSTIRTSLPAVLGIATDITSEELLVLINEKRQLDGAGPLTLNPQLNEAASQKASNMLSENYWAHNSPSGKTPWVFVKNSGYKYVYAGENLAKGFTNSKDVVNAWMASTSHRENMLSQNYNDVGFAVVEGKLLGEETVLIVEMFGNTTALQNQENQATTISSSSTRSQSLVLNSQVQKPLIDSASFSKNFILIFALLFIFILILDMIFVERKKVTRFIGHNLDHIFFFSIIVLIVIVIARGSIL